MIRKKLKCTYWRLAATDNFLFISYIDIFITDLIIIEFDVSVTVHHIYK